MFGWLVFDAVVIFGFLGCLKLQTTPVNQPSCFLIKALWLTILPLNYD